MPGDKALPASQALSWKPKTKGPVQGLTGQHAAHACTACPGHVVSPQPAGGVAAVGP